jgi:hypothetical protein
MSKRPLTSVAVLEILESRQLLSFGTPITAFGANGQSTAAFSTGNADPHEMLVDGSGRIVTVSDAGLARFATNGQLDSTFGTTARGRTAISNLSVRDFAFDSSGRIIVLALGSSGTLLLRYTAAGRLDRSFATNGAAIVTAKKTFNPAALAIDSQNRCVVAGTAKTTDGNGFTTKVFRTTSNGAADTSFNGTGLKDLQLAVTDPLNPTPLDVVVDVEIGAGDNVLVLGGSQAFLEGGSDSDSGQSFDTAYGDAFLVSAQLCAADGSLDGGYGSGGFTRLIYATGALVNHGATAATRLGDGTVVLAASNLDRRAVVARYNAAGVLQRRDVAPVHSPLATPTEISQLSDGRLILLGDSGNNYDSDHLLTTLDDSGNFGQLVRVRELTTDTNGVTHSNAIISSEQAQLAVSGGNIIVGGHHTEAFSSQTLWEIDDGAATDHPDQFANGSVNDVVLDNAGTLHLAYYDSSTTHLMYAKRDPSGVWSKPRVLDAGAQAGVQLSIAVDSKNNPAIAYYDGTNGDLKLAQFIAKTGKWKIGTLDAKGTTGQFPALQFNSTDGPTVAYYSRSGQDLKFVTFENKAWVYEPIDTNGDVGKYDVLEFTPKTGRPSVAYTSASGGVKYAVRNDPGSWSLTDVASTKSGAAYLDLKYGGFDQFGVISYFDAGTADLKVAQFDGSKWKARTIASAGAQGQYTALYTPDSEQYYVYSYSKSRDRYSIFTVDWNDSTTAENVLHTAFGKNAAVAFDDSNDFVVAAFDSVSGKLHVIDRIV